ncbi:MAG: hypothetical protein JWM44_4398 [Bacilli bacterium]|nr:hypothetical protein [Bacilli bacterium]
MSHISTLAIRAHFPEKQSKAFCDYATDVAFLWSRYIFTRRVGKQQYGYCTHCRAEYETIGLKHGYETTCPGCKSLCAVRSSGMGRKSMVDEVYFIWYNRSTINPKGITARGVYGIRDYRDDYHKTETIFTEKALYLFEPGQSIMHHVPYLYFSSYTGAIYIGDMEPSKNVRSVTKNGHMANIKHFCSFESIKEAVQGTPFQYSTWESYEDGDMVNFFSLYSLYPCIEYLTKLGMGGLVDAKLNGHKTYGAINWKGKTPDKILRLNKKEINALRAPGIDVDPLLLRLFHISKKDGSNLTIEELSAINNSIGDYGFGDLQKALKCTTLKKITHYINKQCTKKEMDRHNKRQAISTWNDYIADCVTLGFDLTNEVVMFPSNLHAAHQNTIKQVKVKEDIALQARMAARVKSLEKMKFEANGLMIRAAIDSKELIAEGKALQHCVGNYAESYAKGKTDLFVIRKVDEPDKPFFTMEIRDGSIAQCRGLKNCSPTQDVKAFIDLFTSKKLLTKKRTRVLVNMNQEAAI